jgi:hypothetical protein
VQRRKLLSILVVVLVALGGIAKAQQATKLSSH